MANTQPFSPFADIQICADYASAGEVILQADLVELDL
jgi:hypothetical protein